MQTDEELARRLQFEFDKEAGLYGKTEANRTLSSESDSDVTLDPNDIDNRSSPDLFMDDTCCKNKKKAAKSTVMKRTSTVHEISDSDSDDEQASPTKLKCSTSFHELSDSDPDLKCSSGEKRKHREKVDNDSDETVDLGSDIENTNNSTKDKRPLCQYGSKCYRKNPSHLNEFRHSGPGASQHSPSSKKRKSDVASSPTASSSKKLRTDHSSFDVKTSALDYFNENQPLSVFLTKVRGIDRKFNESGAMHISDVLSESMGNLQSSCHFNYMFDIQWLMKQYPTKFRSKPVLLVHGEQRQSLAALQVEASSFSNIKLCQARLEIMYGTHHTKMMFLLYDNGMRIVIHTSNLIENDWFQKTQGIWISPVFPKLKSTDSSSGTSGHSGDSKTHFKRDLLEYLAAYRARQLEEWQKHIKEHDMSAAKVFIVGSVPGRHTAEKKSTWGHLKLKKVLQSECSKCSEISRWPVVGQFSSIGSLGPNKDSWLCKEWLTSLSSMSGSLSANPNLHLIFPSRHNVRTSLEGYMGGGCLPYSINTAKKQQYLNSFLHQWKSKGRGRTRACPHIKTYTRASPDWKKIAWFLVTSANLSKAAWGALEKNGSQLMIRSYELGVLFLPSHFIGKDIFEPTTDIFTAISAKGSKFPMPYEIPPTPYDKNDRPWMWDVPYTDLPDSHGNMWCPGS